jgi:GWxTD domain-containing protein
MIEANLFKRSVYAASILVALIFGLSLCSFTASAAKHPQLPPTYDHWLNQEVNYLITNQERANFLALTTDQDRDAFIDTFWAIRNPDPNSPGNTYKDEHYRRLEYVNNHYGLPSAGNGWHTDRGMVYITLGPPQQKRSYLNTKYLEPARTN